MMVKRLTAALTMAAAVATGASLVSLPQAQAAPPSFEFRERQNGRYHLVVAMRQGSSPADGGYYLANRSALGGLYLQAKQLDRYGRPTPGWTRLTPDNARIGTYIVAGWSKRWLIYGGIGIRVCENVPRGHDLCGSQYVAFWRPQGNRGGGGNCNNCGVNTGVSKLRWF